MRASINPGAVHTIGQTAFTTREVADAIALIDATGQAPLLEAGLPTGGRPRSVGVRALLVGLLLLARSGQPLYLNRLPAVLNNLTPSQRHGLGIRSQVTRRVTDTLFTRTFHQLDASPHYGGKGLAADAAADRDAKLQAFVDWLVAASLPSDDDYTAPGDLAFDATFIDANSRPVATAKKRLINTYAAQATKRGEKLEPGDVLADDARLAQALGLDSWGEDPAADRKALRDARRSTRDPADRDAATIVHKGTIRHAYAVHLAVDVPTRADVAQRLAAQADAALAKAQGRAPKVAPPEPTPLLIRRLVVTASTAAPGTTGSDLLVGLPTSPPGQRNGWKPSDIVADRGYSNAKPENWHDPLRSAGYHLIHDLHRDHRGAQRGHDGIVIIDGQPYSPGILDHPDLLDIPVPPIGATRAQIRAYQAHIERRRPYLLPRHAAVTHGEPLRLACPAVRGKLACPQRHTGPQLVELAARGVPEVFAPPATPLPPICVNKTVRIPDDVLAQRQDRDLLFGSTHWYDAFHRRRPRVEGINGIAKNPAGPHIAGMRVRVRGRARVSVLVAFVAVATNIAQAQAHVEKQAHIRHLDQQAALARRSRKPRPGDRHPRGTGRHLRTVADPPDQPDAD